MRRVWYCDAEGNAWEALGVAGRCPRCRSRDVFIILYGRRRYQVQNQGHRTSGIDVHRPRSEPPVGRQSLP